MILSPLKDKILTYEQDDIEASIKWKLELGNEIFKKSDVKRAVFWLKAEIKNNSNNLSLKKINSIIDESLTDVTKRRKAHPFYENDKPVIDPAEFFKILSEK